MSKAAKNFYVNVYDKHDREYGVMTFNALVRRFGRSTLGVRKWLRERGDFADFLVSDDTGREVKTTAVRLDSKNDDAEAALLAKFERAYDAAKKRGSVT